MSKRKDDRVRTKLPEGEKEKRKKTLLEFIEFIEFDIHDLDLGATKKTIASHKHSNKLIPISFFYDLYIAYHKYLVKQLRSMTDIMLKVGLIQREITVHREKDETKKS